MELTPCSELTRRWWVLPCAISCLSAEVEDRGRRSRPGGRGRGPGECLSEPRCRSWGFPSLPRGGERAHARATQPGEKGSRGTFPRSGGPGGSPRARTSGADACRPAWTEGERSGGKGPSGRGATGSARRGCTCARCGGHGGRGWACVRPGKAERGRGRSP